MRRYPENGCRCEIRRAFAERGQQGGDVRGVVLAIAAKLNHEIITVLRRIGIAGLQGRCNIQIARVASDDP